ncbi:uncharacterized protein [Mytilus edulis]|uniref:uncharacterized protein n=1 Tax=Mytilus edulis TaxID=6550 RepID=UPI0039EFF66E
MDTNRKVLVLFYIQFIDLFSERFYVTGVQENTFLSNSSVISCDGDTTIKIVDLLVEQHTAICAETKHCNLTELQMNSIKRHCNKERTCTISKLIPNSCLFNDFERVSISYSCTGHLNSSCSFDDLYDRCGWYAQGSTRYKWILWKGKTPSWYTGPDRDHTTSSGYGYYFYTKSLADSAYNDDSFLFSHWIVPSTKQCLSFWYHMYGIHINTLTVFQMNSEHTIELWSKSNNQGNKCFFQSLALTNIGPYQIIFQAIRGDGSKSEIAVDDIIIKNTVCNKVSRLDCNFEEDSCEWKPEPKATYSWTIISGKTPTLWSGPDVDHTSGSNGGHYIYLEGKEIQNGVKSNLTNITINFVDAVCLTFWYHMYGVGMGTLNVYMESKNITKRRWSKSGNQKNLWKFANLDISNSEPYRIIFEGVHGKYDTSDIALDDIFLLQHKCSAVIDYTESCRNIDESISLSECSKYYLQLNNTRLKFEREWKNCSTVYQDVQSSSRTLCNDMNNSDICTFNLSEEIQNDPRCFLSNSLLVEYKCEEKAHVPNILSDDAQKINAPIDKGLVVGMVVAFVLLVCVVVLIFFLIRRRGSFRKTRKNQKNGFHTNNSAGIQTASSANINADINNLNSQLTTTQSNHCNNVYANTEFQDDIIEPDCEYSNIAHTNSVINEKGTTVAKYRNYQGDVPSYNISSKHDVNDFADLTNKTRFIKGPMHQTDSTKSNMIIEPQGNIFEGSEYYQLAQPTCFSDENHQLKDENNDVYCSTEEGTYNFAGSDCHKEAEQNIYSHTVDDVYDSTTHKRKDDDQEDKYDHFIGQLTEDVYVISN